jgi:hypothetical protein
MIATDPLAQRGQQRQREPFMSFAKQRAEEQHRQHPHDDDEQRQRHCHCDDRCRPARHARNGSGSCGEEGTTSIRLAHKRCRPVAGVGGQWSTAPRSRFGEARGVPGRTFWGMPRSAASRADQDLVPVPRRPHRARRQGGGWPRPLRPAHADHDGVQAFHHQNSLPGVGVRRHRRRFSWPATALSPPTRPAGRPR